MQQESILIICLIVLLCIIVMLGVVIENTGPSKPSVAYDDREGFIVNAAHYATFVSSDPEAELRKWDDPALAYPTKCVDCERRFIVGERWRGQQTKCFSCEAMAAASAGKQTGATVEKDGSGMAGYVEIDPQDTHPFKAAMVL